VEFNQVEKTIIQDQLEIVKLQIVIHCFVKKIALNNTELDCLALLGCRGKVRLTEFCALAAELKLMGSSSAVNNCLSRIEKSRLCIKEGVGKKKIFLNPELGIQTQGNILLKYKIVRLEQTNALDKNSKTNSGTTVVV
jgi:hypothetical protein